MNLTESISINAAPERVLSFVADARNLPVWAPTFAQEVRRDGDRWLVVSGPAELRIEVRVSPDHGTVDFVGAGGAGVFTRVVPNRDGSEYVFTRPLPAAMTPDDVAGERAIVADELATVRAHCEAT